MSAPIGMTQTELDDFIPADVDYEADTVTIAGRRHLRITFSVADADRMIPDLPHAIEREYDEGHGDRIVEGWSFSTNGVRAEILFPGSYLED